MNNGFVKIATFVPKIKVANVEYNAQLIKDGISQAQKQDCDIVVFPELSLLGATAGDLFFSDTLLNASVKVVEDIVEFSCGIKMMIVFGSPIKLEGKLFDCAITICDGKVLGIVPKKCVYSELNGRKIFSNTSTTKNIDILNGSIPFGNDIIFTNNNLKVKVVLKDDFMYLENNSYANIIINPCATPKIIGSDEEIKNQVINNSRKNVCGYVFVNAGEGESTSDTVFGGYSIFCENGKVIKECKSFNLGLNLTEIDIDYLDFERSKNPYLFSDEIKGYKEEVPFLLQEKGEITRKYALTPFVPTEKEKMDFRAREILDIQAHSLAKRIEHTKAKTVVLGLSGGLDSTLALIGCVKTMQLLGRPNKDIITCLMPCFGTSSRTLDNSIALAKAFGTTIKKIDISKTVERHLKDIKHQRNVFDSAFENAQARERTQVLMDIANMENGLVIGTGDMSELALGWATYNGDQMSMYGLNCTITKTLVRAVVNSFALSCKPKLKGVLLDIIDTPVSPELIPSKTKDIAQKTEDLVGPYVLHDFFIYHLIGRGTTPKKVLLIAKKTFDGIFTYSVIVKWLKVFIKRFFAQQFKRSCSPDGVKVGNIDLSIRGNLKIPTDCSSDTFLSDIE